MPNPQSERELGDGIKRRTLPNLVVFTARKSVPFIELQDLGFDVLHQLVMDLFGMNAELAAYAFDGAFVGFADPNRGFEAVLIGKAISDG